MAQKIKIAKRHTDLPKPYYIKAMAEMRRLGDRGCVIVGAAYLDLLLRSALEYRMRKDVALFPKLFENRGTLGDFSAKINVAYAFEVIGYGAYGDLHLIREIRNAFAHSAEKVTFKQEDVASHCSRLWFPKNIGTTGKDDPCTPRELFVRGVQHLADGLYSSTHPDLAQSRFIHFGPVPPEPSPTPPKKPKERVSRGRPENPTSDK